MGRITKREEPPPSLLKFREDRELSQADAAALVGIDQSHWCRLENGETFAGPKLAKKLSELTGVSLETLLGIADDDSGVHAGGRQKTA